MPNSHAEPWMKDHGFFSTRSISMTNVEGICKDSQLYFEDFPIDELGHEDMAIWCTMLLRQLKSLGKNPQDEALVQLSWHNIRKRQ